MIDYAAPYFCDNPCFQQTWMPEFKAFF